MRRIHAQILLLVALALLAGGCAKSKDPVTTSGTNSPTPTGTTASKSERPKQRPTLVVAQEQIAGAPVDSAERTVLEWWRDVQVNDPEHALGLYVDPPTLPNLAGQFNFVAGRLNGAAKVVAVEQQGDRTVARVRWSQPNGDARNVTLRLEEIDGAWRLLDTRFLDEMVEDLQAGDEG
jgi:hypothetical protein